MRVVVSTVTITMKFMFKRSTSNKMKMKIKIKKRQENVLSEFKSETASENRTVDRLFFVDKKQ